MSVEKRLTGYPSIDKPHLKFYRKIPIRDIKTEQTIYDLVFESNKDHMSDIAVGYLGTEMSFQQLKSKVDTAAAAFYKHGIRENDTVLVGVSNSPEAMIVLLPLNKIGAVSKWFDVRAGEKDIEDYANDSGCKCIVIFDMLLPKVQKILDNTCLKSVIVISPVDSLSSIKRALFKLKSKVDKTYMEPPNDKRYIAFRNLMKTGNPLAAIPCAKFSKDKPTVMIQSSGTTGKPKTIVHSDYSCAACTAKIAYSDIPFGRGKTILVLLPPWIAYGLGDAIVLPMALGSKVELSPTFSPNAIVPYLGKFAVSFAAPMNYRYLRDHFDLLTHKQKQGLDKMECLISGGDKISVEENQNFEELFHTKLVNGYGNNEGWGALTVNPTQYNKYGTVGIPKYEETVIAYDNDTKRELPYGEVGEICSLCDTMFLYYENNPKDTDLVKRVHPDGKLWLHTGDLGFVDEDGFVTLCGRLRRVIVRGGFKISAYTIEDKICEHNAVKECVTVAVNDSAEEHVPMAYVLLKPGFEKEEQKVQTELLTKCNLELKQYEVPKYFRFVDSLPYTDNGKYDFRQLEDLGNEYVHQLG